MEENEVKTDIEQLPPEVTGDSISERLYKIILDDDLNSLESLLSDEPNIEGVKLGMFPLLSVAVLLGANRIADKLSETYKYLAKFKEEEAPVDLMMKGAACFLTYADMYKDVHFVEPSEIYILKGDISGFEKCILKCGIKTMSSRKRVEKIAYDLKPDHVLIPAKEENTYKFVKPRNKKKTIMAIIIVLAALIVVSIPTIILASLRTTVYFYSDGQEWGHQDGLSGTAIKIESPEKENYRFTGWFTDEECTESANGKISKKHKELYAGWELIILKVGFNYQGKDVYGNDVAEISGSFTSQMNLPVLKEDGKLFLGWFDENGDRMDNGNFTRSCTLTPRFKDIVINDGVYVLSDGEDLLYIDTIDVEKVVLDKDVTLSDSFKSAGLNDKYESADYVGFDKIFDGQGHTITYGKSTYPLFTVLGENAKVKNFKIVCKEHLTEKYTINRFGFVSLLSNGEISDVEIELGSSDGVDADGNQVDGSLHLYDYNLKLAYVGGIVGGNNGVIQNCNVTGNVRCATPSTSIANVYFGGIAGSNTGKIVNTQNNADVYSTVRTAGIAGANMGEIKGCVNNGHITLSNGLSSQNVSLFVAGIVANSEGLVESCVNNGKIDVIAVYINSYQAGIAAISAGDVKSCVNNGEITTLSNRYIYTSGGVVGYAVVSQNSFEISDCINNGKIEGKDLYIGRLGGIVGTGFGKDLETNTLSITRCINKGEVSNAMVTGGLVGYAGYVSVSLSRNEGNITASSKNSSSPAIAGGIAAQFFYGRIQDGINRGDVKVIWEKNVDEEAIGMSAEEYAATIDNYAGGIAAIFDGSEMLNCYTTGNVDGKYGFFGLYAGIASTDDSDCFIQNVYALSVEGVELGWTAYSSEEDEQGNYVHVDDKGQPIYTPVDAINAYSFLADTYSLADYLGSSFVNVSDDSPIFVWETVKQ